MKAGLAGGLICQPQQRSLYRLRGVHKFAPTGRPFHPVPESTFRGAPVWDGKAKLQEG